MCMCVVDEFGNELEMFEGGWLEDYFFVVLLYLDVEGVDKEMVCVEGEQEVFKDVDVSWDGEKEVEKFKVKLVSEGKKVIIYEELQ